MLSFVPKFVPKFVPRMINKKAVSGFEFLTFYVYN